MNLKFFRKRRIFSFFIAAGLGLHLMGGAFLTVHAEVIDYQARAEANKLMTIESNQIDGWPQGPAVSAKSAILMEANTGTILYAKNIHEQLYPASTTKILTAWIARQSSSLDETVEYSSEAVNSINWREDSNIGIKVGESISMEQSLYGLLVGSGNECGNAIGEHISGSIDAFVDLMNRTAEQLGCTDSHFVTTNGIHDDEHYTSAHDMALIAQKFFSDELLCKMSSTASYVIPESPTLSRELIPNSKNNLLPGKKYAYEYLVGSKTGYTSKARQNLVSCAQKDGLKLICVVMEDESPMQFTDTIDLFNYGFSNFQAVNASENDTTYSIQGNGFFMTENDIFGDSEPILSLDGSSYVVLPSDASFADVTSELDYENVADGQAALIRYNWNDQPVGTAAVLFSDHISPYDFNADPSAETAAETVGDTGSVPASVPASDTATAVDESPAAASSGAEPSFGETPEPEAAESGEADSAASDSGQASALPAASGTSRGGDSGGQSGPQNVVFVNIRNGALILGGIAALVILILVIYSALRNRTRSRRRQAIMKHRREHRDEIIDFDRYIDPF